MRAALRAVVFLIGAALLAAPASMTLGREDGPERIYVTSQDAAAVSVIDVAGQEVVATIDLTSLGFTANCKPHHVAVEPDGSYWYVSLIADWRVLKFDRDNHLVAQVAFETPGLLAVDPHSSALYVGRSMAAVSPPMRIGMIDRSSMAIDELDVFFPRPHALAISRDGSEVYTASLAENRMAALDPAEDGLELFDVPGNHMHSLVQFAISPDGNTMVAGGEMTGEIMVWDVSNPRAPSLITSLSIGGQPWHPTWSPDGSLVYFPQRTADAVAVIDATAWEMVAQITGGGLYEPHGSGLSADGRWLFVSARNTAGEWGETPDGGKPAGTVNVIDTTTREVVKVLAVPAYAAGLGTRAR